MIFGDWKEFSIECAISDRRKTNGQILFGRIAIWAEGCRLGDFLLTVILNVPALFFRESLKDCGQRRDETLMGMDAEQVWNFLDAVLYAPDYKSSFSPEELEKKYRKFCICPGFSEAFDGETAFLLEDDEGERCIWMDSRSKLIKKVRLRPETYKNVVESFISWYSSVTEYTPVQ